jgi:peroxiredoxin
MMTNQLVDEQVKAAEQEWLESWRVGPTYLHWTEPPVQYGDPAPNLRLQSTSGAWVELSSLWARRPVLLMFWRHFGCSCGMDRAKRLKKEYNNYIAAGGQVVVITQGEPERAQLYVKQFEVPGLVLCSPDLSAYRAYNLLEGTPAQIMFDASPDLLRRKYAAGMQLCETRRAEGRPLVDSPWQLPGEFVIDQQGIIRLIYRYNFCEDWPDARVLTSAIVLLTEAG